MIDPSRGRWRWTPHPARHYGSVRQHGYDSDYDHWVPAAGHPHRRPRWDPVERRPTSRRSYMGHFELGPPEWSRHRRQWRRAFDAARPDDPSEPHAHNDRRERPRRGEPRSERRRRPPDRPGREEGWRSRGREFVRRFREPLIGIAVAGALAPLVKGAQQAQAPRRALGPGEAEAPERRRAGPGERRPVDQSLAGRWAAARAEQDRRDTIEGAVVNYGIAPSLAADIYDIAEAEGIEPDLAYGLINTESEFDERAVSNVGARGLTQVMPRTARWLLPGTNAEELFDRELNMHLGFGYLRDLIGKYNGNLRLALLAYNRGPGTVDRVLAEGGDPDNGYADKVLSG